jgi:hypothetical protein
VTDDVDAVVLVPVRTPLKAPVVEEIPAENVLSPVKVFVLRVAPTAASPTELTFSLAAMTTEVFAKEADKPWSLLFNNLACCCSCLFDAIRRTPGMEWRAQG